jgi:hypothetical protein
MSSELTSLQQANFEMTGETSLTQTSSQQSSQNTSLHKSHEELKVPEGSHPKFETIESEPQQEIPSKFEIVSSQKRVTSVRKILDELGNVISEDIETTLGDNFDEKSAEDIVKEMQGASSQQKITSVRKVLDEFGNIK